MSSYGSNMSSTSDKICKEGASQTKVDLSDAIGYLQLLNIKDNKAVGNVCANCGKEGSSDNTNTCNKCKEVKYCNAACKKKHRSKHKKACDRRVAELHDEKLFKQPPPKEDCPICFLRLPTLVSGSRYKTCCGKTICSGCSNAPVYDNQGNKVDEKKCAFCRVPTPTTDEEINEMEKKRFADNDPIAIFNIGLNYSEGMYGYPLDYVKALELWHQAAGLGYTGAYTNIGYAYNNGEGVEINKKKAIHYFELAAMRGDVTARYNLGIEGEKADNFDRALKHHMIAVRDGHENSLKEIQKMYSYGHATKDDYTKALQLYQEYLSEIKSDQREKAAAAKKENRYY